MPEQGLHDEGRFHALARAVSDGVLVLDSAGRILFANTELESLAGRPPEALLGQEAGSLFPPAARRVHEAALERLRDAPDAAAVSERHELAVTPNGRHPIPLAATYGAYEKDGERCFTVILRDLSERRRTESRLRFQARLLDAVGEAVIATDPAGRILYWNGAAERLYGWTAEEVAGRPVEEVTPTSMSRAEAEAIMQRLRDGESWSGEFMVQDRWGREFPALVTDSPVMDEDGTLVGVIGTSTDISERKRAEEGQRFLSEVGRVLASSLNHETTLSHVSRLAVPMLGDWCMVHLLDGGPPTQVAHCAPPGRYADLAALEEVLTGEGQLLARALPAEQPLLVRRRSPLLTDAARAELDRMRLGELLVVPLAVRSQPIGVMTFARAVDKRHYDDEDLRLAGELGLRAASAIENARLYGEAEESDRAKTDFLAVVSHELRTPLNAILGYAELLRGGISGELNEKQESQIERIGVSAGHLARLIDEILTFARMERGSDTLELESLDAAEVVREAVMILQPSAREKGLPLRVDVPAGPLEVRSDAAKLRQVVVNLVSNAVKYTEAGSVTVELSERPEGIEISVRDTGVGIPRDQQERIFEPFRQVQSPNTRTVGGTGLGLSVSRRLVELLGGQIEVSSDPGAGSTFTVRLPKSHPDGNGPRG